MKYSCSLFFLTLLAFSFSATAQDQKINTIAGNGFQGFIGDGGTAPAASLAGPIGVAVDKSGNVYIDDYFNNRIRKINAAGMITTIAGNGTMGYSGNGSISTSAELTPYGIALDNHGNVFMSDANYGVIRKINSLNIITTYAGNGMTWGYAGDGGLATNARLNHPYGITFDSDGNLYIADAGNHVVRKVDTAGIITTVAGIDTAGFSGDGSLAVLAKLDSPYAVAVDKKGNLFINDYYNNRIRMVDQGGIITTYAGDGTYGSGGNGGSAILAQLNKPRGIAVDTFGNLYIADAMNNVIRKVDTNGIISNAAGNGYQGFGGDLGYQDGANLFNPCGVAVDVYGSIYIADANNERIRKTYTPGLLTGVGNTPAAAALEAHPNPFNRQVTVSGLSKSDKVSLMDVAGRQVSETWDVAADGIQTFDINSITPGVYLLQVNDKSGNKKALIQMIKE